MMGLQEIRAILDRETRNAKGGGGFSRSDSCYVLARTLAEFDRSMKHPQHVFGSEPACIRCGAYGPDGGDLTPCVEVVTSGSWEADAAKAREVR